MLFQQIILTTKMISPHHLLEDSIGVNRCLKLFIFTVLSFKRIIIATSVLFYPVLVKMAVLFARGFMRLINCFELLISSFTYVLFFTQRLSNSIVISFLIKIIFLERALAQW